jgi:hypothetical protein
MARYKPYDLNQAKMIALSYADQIVEGSFEHALNEIVEEHLDLTVFEKRYSNDETGRLAYDPKILLKVVLYCSTAITRASSPAGRSPRPVGETWFSWRWRRIPDRILRPWLRS